MSGAFVVPGQRSSGKSGILLSGIGKLAIEQPILRALGVGLSLYWQIMVLWTVRTLARLLIPGLAVYQDHVLVTSGPFRWLRHPLYSGALALWLGAALGTLNWVLLPLWPLLVVAVLRELPTEEGMIVGTALTTNDPDSKQSWYSLVCSDKGEHGRS